MVSGDSEFWPKRKTIWFWFSRSSLSTYWVTRHTPCTIANSFWSIVKNANQNLWASRMLHQTCCTSQPPTPAKASKLCWFQFQIMNPNHDYTNHSFISIGIIQIRSVQFRSGHFRTVEQHNQNITVFIFRLIIWLENKIRSNIKS